MEGALLDDSESPPVLGTHATVHDLQCLVVEDVANGSNGYEEGKAEHSGSSHNFFSWRMRLMASSMVATGTGVARYVRVEESNMYPSPSWLMVSVCA